MSLFDDVKLQTAHVSLDVADINHVKMLQKIIPRHVKTAIIIVHFRSKKVKLPHFQLDGGVFLPQRGVVAPVSLPLERPPWVPQLHQADSTFQSEFRRVNLRIYPK